MHCAQEVKISGSMLKFSLLLKYLEWEVDGSHVQSFSQQLAHDRDGQENCDGQTELILQPETWQWKETGTHLKNKLQYEVQDSTLSFQGRRGIHQTFFKKITWNFVWVMQHDSELLLKWMDKGVWIPILGPYPI